MEMNKALPMRPDKTNFSHYNLKVKKLQVDLLFLLPRITDTIPDIPTVTKDRRYSSYALEIPLGQLLSTTFFKGSRIL